MTKESLEHIYREQHELSVYGGIGALLGWDQMTYMPPGGAEDRANQLALIARLSHEKVISDDFFNHTKILSQPSTLKKLASHDQIVIERLKKDLEKARKIPSWFVEKSAKTTTLSFAAWETARKKQDYNIFAPHLEKVIDLEQQYCGFINLSGHPYNSLLDGYEEGITTDILTREFSVLKKHLQNLVKEITESKKYAIQKQLNLSFTQNEQKNLTKLVLSQMNLPKEQFRIDISTHPFTTALGDNDVRITTNYDRSNPLFSLFSTIHEAGHALYELGLPKEEFKDTVISDAASVGLHESQSRFWENMIGRNIHFWQYFYHRCIGSFPKFTQSGGYRAWYEKINQVQPSLIRVEADELTYCLHVILRYELELDLIKGKLLVNELPQLWNDKIKEYLGVTPQNDVEGVLQDMHWSGGSFGYFPTYAIGSIYAAQLFKQLITELPETFEKMQKGNISFIHQWLTTNIHNYGRQLTAEEIIKKTCGEGLQSDIYIQYLKDKYYELYSIS
jgi:carboxypeptidase Taq